MANLDWLLANLSNFDTTETACVTCTMKVQMLQAQYSFLNSVGWGIFLIGLGVFLWGITTIFREVRTRAGRLKESSKIQDILDDDVLNDKANQDQDDYANDR